MTITVQNLVSVDGFAADADGGLDFFDAVEDFSGPDRRNVELLADVDVVVLGAATYRMFVEYWPTATEPVAEHVNRLPKLVVSSSAAEAPWGDHAPATMVRGGVEGLLAEVGDRRALVWGSLTLVDGLLAVDAVDRLWLQVCPVVLGSGTPHPRRPVGLTLLEAHGFDGGLVSLHYAVHTHQEDVS